MPHEQDKLDFMSCVSLYCVVGKGNGESKAPLHAQETSCIYS